MTITIKLKTSNAAFKDDKQAAIKEILESWAAGFGTINMPSQGLAEFMLLTDVNGNSVGSVKVTGN